MQKLYILSFEILIVHLNHINFLLCNYKNQKHLKKYIYNSKDTIPNHYLNYYLYYYIKILLINYLKINLILKKFFFNY